MTTNWNDETDRLLDLYAQDAPLTTEEIRSLRTWRLRTMIMDVNPGMAAHEVEAAIKLLAAARNHGRPKGFGPVLTGLGPDGIGPSSEDE